jgi:hypothetical protein
MPPWIRRGFGNLRVVALEQLLADRRIQEFKVAYGAGKLLSETGRVYMLSQGPEQILDIPEIDQ